MNSELADTTEKPSATRKLPKFGEIENGNLNLEIDSPDMMKNLYGVKTPEMGDGLTVSAIHALGDAYECYRPMMFALAAEIEPKDAVEAMLVVQMGVTHAAMTGMAKRVVDANNTQLRESYERSMTRLSRTYLAQMDAFKKYRAKAQQTVRVERVTVESGGQAIVGSVETGGEV